MNRIWCILKQQLKEKKEYFGSSRCFNVGKEPPTVDVRKPRNINTNN